MIILGIETSCDETAAAVVQGHSDKVKVLSNIVSSQIAIHKKYGGVVPEVAAREHVLNILPVINEALEQAGVIPTHLAPFLLRRGGAKRQRKIKSPYPPLLKGVDAIAVTVGPGLVTSLMVGVETAKTLAYVWGLPVAAVNHIEGHIYANFIGANSKFQIPNSKQILNSKLQTNTKYNPPAGGQNTNKIKFPAVVLTVSGGHTMLILMTGHGRYKTLGETRDDAAGEAFDKAAQLLNLGYPGGPAVAAEAAKFKQKIIPLVPPSRPNDRLVGRVSRGIELPRPMINSNDFDFSFSGLKTALLYALKKDKNWCRRIPAYAAEFQNAAVEVLVHKTIKAALALNCKTVMLSGGVAANLELRNRLTRAVKEKITGAGLIIPDLKYCTDNAAMIAAAGYFRARKKDFTPWQKLKAEPNKEFK